MPVCDRLARGNRTGVTLFAEYASPLRRPRLFTRSRLSGFEREELFDIFLAACRWTRVYYAWRPNLKATTTSSS